MSTKDQSMVQMFVGDVLIGAKQIWRRFFPGSDGSAPSMVPIRVQAPEEEFQSMERVGPSRW